MTEVCDECGHRHECNPFRPQTAGKVVYFDDPGDNWHGRKGTSLGVKGDFGDIAIVWEDDGKVYATDTYAALKGHPYSLVCADYLTEEAP